jgi:hypothetical protein
MVAYPAHRLHSDSTPNYRLQQFGDETAAVLAQAGIAIQVNESSDGARSICAWLVATPDHVADFSIDQVPVGTEHARRVAMVIERCLTAN